MNAREGRRPRHSSICMKGRASNFDWTFDLVHHNVIFELSTQQEKKIMHELVENVARSCQDRDIGADEVEHVSNIE